MKPNALPQVSPSLNHPKRVKALLTALLLTTAFLAEAQSPVPDNFNPSASATVYSLAVQPDGKILVGGDFTSLAGYSRTAMGRLNTNGTLDTAFTMTVTTPPVGYSQTVRVQGILVQPDGKLVVGGRTTLTPPVGPAITTGFISRLNTNGTTDMSFITTSGVNGPVTSLAFQADGRILAGGLFTTLRGQTRNRLGRLNADGSLDTAFNPGANSTVLTLAVQGDDMILVGGAFSSVGAEPRTNLARLYPDGTVDAVFAPAVTGSGASVYSLALQTDGKIFLSGLFASVAGEPHAHLARLNADGTPDSGFNPTANTYVYSLALQPDGKILAGGDFTQFGGQSRSRIARLNSTEPATQSLDYDGFTFTWQRGGNSPEVWRTTIEASTNLTNWSYLGEGARIPGGWQFTASSLPPDSRARVRGYVTGGGYNSSSWFVQTISGPVSFLAQPVGRTNSAGTLAGFSVAAMGSPPLTYQWLKNGSPVSDGGQISGAQTAALTLGNVFGADAGSYSVIVSNSFGSVTSVVATLKVIDPNITGQPADSTNALGTAVTFYAAAQGTAPLVFQWRKDNVNLEDGGNITGAHTPTLTVSNLSGADAGLYSARVTNAFGTNFTWSAKLTVRDPVLTSQPLDRLASPGQPVSFSLTVTGTPPLHYVWRRDGTNLPAASAPSLTLTNVTWADEGSYDVVVTNAYGSVTSTVALLSVSLAVAESWSSDVGYAVQTFALQPDGKFLLAALGSQRYGLARLLADGTTEAGFNPQVPGSVYSLLLQLDGKILFGGWFNSLALGGLRRLNADGSWDSFNPGANSAVFALVAQAGDQILAGGSFSLLGGYSRAGLGRVYPNGVLDYSFTPEANGDVYCVAVQADGRFVVGGNFSTLAGQSCKFLGRLNTNGTLDTSFTAPVAVDSPVFTLAVQPDGKILVARNFTLAYGSFHYPLLRLNADGTVDGDFYGGNDNYVNALVLQADGKILLGGSFTSLHGKPRMHIGRLNPDGSVDARFNPGANGVVNALALQADGKVLVGGEFGSLGGQPRAGVGRLNATDPATQSLELAGSTLTWLRGGTCPEVWSTNFEVSTDGTNWTALGTGTRVPGGWRLNGVAVPSTCTIRARGFVSGGRYNGSTWYVETFLAVTPVLPPKILTTDGNFGFRTNGFGFNLSAASGQAVVVEASTNLATWIPIHTNLMGGSGLFLFRDPESGLRPSRFYRARLYVGTLPPPTIPSGSPLGFQGGRFGFNIAGVAGQTVLVETSTNLQSWLPLQTNTLGAAMFYFSDSASSNAPSRFYRARLLP